MALAQDAGYRFLESLGGLWGQVLQDQANGRSYSPSISYDGRFVAFVSRASNLVAHDTNGTSDIFVRDRETDATRRVSVNDSGAQANGPSRSTEISPGGRFVAFDSRASNLLPNDTNGQPDVFVHRRGATAP